MASRTRDPSDSLPPIPLDPTNQWMGEVTSNLIRVDERVGAVEKSVDGLSREVRESNSTSMLAARALERIAKAEEDRNDIERDAAKQALAAQKEADRNRDKWLTRAWETPAFQLLLTGTVYGILQLMGVAYLMNRLLGGAGGGTP